MSSRTPEAIWDRQHVRRRQIPALASLGRDDDQNLLLVRELLEDAVQIAAPAAVIALQQHIGGGAAGFDHFF